MFWVRTSDLEVLSALLSTWESQAKLPVFAVSLSEFQKELDWRNDSALKTEENLETGKRVISRITICSGQTASDPEATWKISTKWQSISLINFGKLLNFSDRRLAIKTPRRANVFEIYFKAMAVCSSSGELEKKCFKNVEISLWIPCILRLCWRKRWPSKRALNQNLALS